jgi:hypothetical protein
MSPELDSTLCERYPQLFRDRHRADGTTAMSRGFEIGDGWFALVEAACGVISAQYLSAVRQYEWSRGRERDGDADVGSVEVERARLAMAAITSMLMHCCEVA